MTCRSCIDDSSMNYRWIIDELSMMCRWFIDELSMNCRWIIHELSIHYRWLVDDLSMVCQCIFDELSMTCRGARCVHSGCRGICDRCGGVFNFLVTLSIHWHKCIYYMLVCEDVDWCMQFASWFWSWFLQFLSILQNACCCWIVEISYWFLYRLFRNSIVVYVFIDFLSFLIECCLHHFLRDHREMVVGC